MKYNIQQFDALSTSALYNILQVRSQVFVVEQHCIYADADGIDNQCHHLSITNTNAHIMAYARLIPPSVVYTECSIGRVLTSQAYRQLGYGKLIVKYAMEQCKILYPQHHIKIGAQLYLQAFYQSFGFVTCSQVYDEDGIEHIKMVTT